MTASHGQEPLATSAVEHVRAKSGAPGSTRERVLVEDQLCFALYAASRAVMGAYRSGLAELGLTYPQYLTMLAVWQQDGSTVSALGRVLSLDSGTLSPLIQRLVRDGFVRKERSGTDERAVRIFSTAKGLELETSVRSVRERVERSTGLSSAEFVQLRTSLHTLRETIEGQNTEQ